MELGKMIDNFALAFQVMKLHEVNDENFEHCLWQYFLLDFDSNAEVLSFLNLTQ